MMEDAMKDRHSNIDEKQEDTEMRTDEENTAVGVQTEESVDELKKQLEEKTKLAEEYLDLSRRLKAEFDNYKKRTEKERIEEIKWSNEFLIRDLLDVIDSFVFAEKKIKDESVLEGLRNVKKSFLSILEAKGLKQMNALGEQFNPEMHDAMMTVEDAGKEDGVITEEFQPGYFLNGRIIRHAKVIVVDNKQGDDGKLEISKQHKHEN